MENITENEYSSYNNMATLQEIRDIVNKYISNKDIVEKLFNWATDKAEKYFIKNINNTKTNIEETKFDPKNNIGIEYSKDSKNKLSYRNKPLILTNVKYSDLCNMIRITSGVEKEILRYLLFGIKCIEAGADYNIDVLQDLDYEKYFNVLDVKYNIPCPACKSKNTTPMMIQTRAADEPPLVRHACRDCKKHFRPPKFRDFDYKTYKKEDTLDDAPSPPDSPTPPSPIEDLIISQNDDYNPPE
ncbi:RNA polymerase subunit [Eptesipox virus]|uniref:DNA-directed RNA polymerase 30 kDa polypeptide n=1 Tax=Eptesipox virus TaxID=1329402 RepID=A0A220T6A1_9POXV|nr:RNA polymerase subunit [Eptesipox virus]ASK51239.1 RNA polymerase subunit [Eptesipox virus]WAH70997.1 RNA polymerase subunit [Eptesipox virus]